MHENFLSYIMIGLSRGLLSAPARSPRQFDEEAFLRQEAKLARRETQAKATEPKAPDSHDIAFGRRHAKVEQRPLTAAGGQPCRAA